MLAVFIIERRHILRSGIKYILEKRGDIISMDDYLSVDEVFRSGSTKEVDLVFMGVDGNLGLEKFRSFENLKRRLTHTRIIVYDSDASLDSCIRYIRSGAKAYLSNSFDSGTLETCIASVLDEKIYIDPIYQSSLIEGLINGQWKSLGGTGYPNSKEKLTSRQNEIAMLFAQGMSTSRIAQKLGLQPSTISTVKSKIYAKLKVDSIIGLSKKISSK